ncbi:class I SAM-dependent methyltransferase [Mycobacterium sp.]|uniref:class I SAM-dependent methyltransferase n=1 Tax=Mycobacterium sp. TaxID=1785 RepID=UPI003BAA9892
MARPPFALPVRFSSSRWHLDRWIAEAGRVGSGKSFRVLDAGAGIAPYRHHFEHVTYETADFGAVDKQYAHLDYTCRLEELPMADETYDLVLCSQVLEHVPDPIAVLREIRRVLKPDGQAWLSAPLFYEEHETPYDFCRYTQFAWRRMAAEAGFTVESLEWLEGYYGTISYQLMMASNSLPAVWLPVRFVCFVFSLMFGLLDTKFKITNRGMPKNYRCVLRAASADGPTPPGAE